MQHDEVIWQLVMHGHCSFRAKTKVQNFCRNEYNVTGLCNRSSCPLANSRYATIREDNGRCYLYIKTIERAHTPKNMWQKIRLKRQYAQALEQIDSHLVHWPKFLVHKNKQRLTKITQYLIRMRRLALRSRPKLVTMPARKEKQLRRKEAKAETAAQLEVSIERELLARLQAGTYGDIYNFPTKQYEKVLSKEENAEEEKAAAAATESEAEYEEYVEGDEDEDSGEEELESEEEQEIEYLEGNEFEASDEDLEDYGDYSDSQDDEGGEPLGRAAGPAEAGSDLEGEAAAPVRPGGKRKGAAPASPAKAVAHGGAKRRMRGRVEIEYEMEREDLWQLGRR